MKSIVLAAGFGTRLAHDLAQSPVHIHLRGIPKPLLPIQGKPIISHWYALLKGSANISASYLVTNASHANHYFEWACTTGFDPKNIVVNDIHSNESRQGALTDLNLVINQKGIEDDVLIIAGDTLLQGVDMMQEIHDFATQQDHLVFRYTLENHEDTRNRGIIEISSKNHIIKYFEKPDAGKTNSRMAVVPVYFYKKRALPLLKAYIQSKPKIEFADAPGNFLGLLSKEQRVLTKEIPGRHDLGTLKGYLNATLNNS